MGQAGMTIYAGCHSRKRSASGILLAYVMSYASLKDYDIARLLML